jgi:hypothetical protein
MVVQASGSAIQAFRIAADGSVLDAAPLILSSGASGLGFPKIAHGAGVYLIAWAQTPSQAIRAARVTSAGQVLDPGGINVSGGGTDVDAFVDFDGQNFFVVWSRQDGSGTDLWGAAVSPDGALAAAPALVLDGNPLNIAFAGPMAYNDSDHLIALTLGEPVFSTTDLYALRVNRQRDALGAPAAVDTVPGEGSSAYGVAAWDSQFFLVWEKAWVRGFSYVYDTEGARMDAAGNVLDVSPMAVSTCAAWQIASAVSFDGTNFLGIFADWREGKPDYQPDLYAVRITPTGQRLDEAGIRVASGVTGMPEDEPDAVFGGGQHAIVYEKQVGAVREVRLSRVLPDGTLLDPDGIVVFANEPTGGTYRPKIAWNGQKYGVVWLDDYLFPGQQPLQFALVGVDGTIEYGPASIPGTFDAAVSAFEIGSDGNEFLVAWVDVDQVRATRIASNGAVLGTQSVQATGGWLAEWPKVAFNGDSYLIAWSQWSNDGLRVYARRVSRSGAPLGTLIAVVGPYDLAVPMEVFNLGTDFAVVSVWRQDGPVELLSARFDANGTPVGPAESLMSLPWDETYAGSSAAMTPGGRLLAIHSLWAGMPYNAPRAQAQFFALGAPLPGDLDGDGDIDLADFGIFAGCMSGPGVPRSDGCEASDQDADGDIDLDDFADFSRLVAAP